MFFVSKSWFIAGEMEEDDPVIIRAKSRSDLGLSRNLTRDYTRNPPMPSRGGTRSLPIWQRIQASENLTKFGD